MASALTDKLSRLVKEMRGQARITESNVQDMLREVRMALLEADVALPVVRDFVGHGIGRRMHEEPPVPNFGQPGTGLKLVPGLVIAIEPMVNAGDSPVRVLDDGWTVVTRDGSRSAHFEHTVALTEEGVEVLTSVNEGG